MTNSIQGFNQSAIIKYEINANEVILLNWMKGFASAINVDQFIEPETEHKYFWIKYSKVLNDLPAFYKNIFQLRKSIKHLSSTNIGEKPLLLKLVHSLRNGTKTYFAFDPIVRIEMEDKPDMNSILDDKPIASKKDHKQAHKLNPNINKIIDSLLSIKNNDSKLFRDKSPIDDHTYTQGLKHFSEKVFAIYEGKFFAQYHIDDSFYRRNEDHDLDKAKKTIQSCKGNWNTINEVLMKAAKNYATWFDPSNNPSNKEWLPKNIDGWIFTAHNNHALFLACIDCPAFPIRENSAEHVYNSVDARVSKVFEDLLKEEWDGFTFWTKIKSVEMWYKKYANKIMNEDTSANYWLDDGIAKWCQGYKEFITKLAGEKGIYEKHLGTGCPSWSAFLREAKEAHGIEAFLPNK